MKVTWKKLVGWVVTALVVVSSCMTISGTLGLGSEDKTEDTTQNETAQVQVIE